MASKGQNDILFTKSISIYYITNPGDADLLLGDKVGYTGVIKTSLIDMLKVI